MEIPHSELFPGSSAVPVLFGAITNGYTMHSFYSLSFFLLPHFGVGPRVGGDVEVEEDYVMSIKDFGCWPAQKYNFYGQSLDLA